MVKAVCDPCGRFPGFFLPCSLSLFFTFLSSLLFRLTLSFTTAHQLQAKQRQESQEREKRELRRLSISTPHQQEHEQEGEQKRAGAGVPGSLSLSPPFSLRSHSLPASLLEARAFSLSLSRETLSPFQLPVFLSLCLFLLPGFLSNGGRTGVALVKRRRRARTEWSSRVARTSIKASRAVAERLGVSSSSSSDSLRWTRCSLIWRVCPSHYRSVIHRLSHKSLRQKGSQGEVK